MSRTKRRAGTTGTSTTRDDQSSRASSCFHFYQAGPSTGRRRAGTTDEPGRPTNRAFARGGGTRRAFLLVEPGQPTTDDDRRAGTIRAGPTTDDEPGPSTDEPGLMSL